MQLPQGEDELRDRLERAAARFGDVIAGAEARADREGLERRLALLRAHAPRLERQGIRLAELGERAALAEARELLEAVQAEIRLAERRLEAAAGAAPAPQGGLQPPAETAAGCVPGAALESAGEPGPGRFAEPARDAAPAAPPMAAASPPAARPDADPRARAEETFRGAQELDQMAFSLAAHQAEGRDTGFEREELEARLWVLAARGRLLQEELPSLADSSTAEGRIHREAFGIMTRIAGEVVRPRGGFVSALQRSWTADWRAELEQREARLQEILRQRGAASERAARERREQQERAAHARLQALSLEELRALAAPQERDAGWAWDFLDAVRDIVDQGQAGDDEVLRLVAPHARLVAHGAEFRVLRRHLRRWMDEAASAQAFGAAPASAEAAEGTTSVPAGATLAAVHPHERLRGALAGLSGAIVGASSREERRVRLQQFFGLAELEWVENERGEAADASNLARRIAGGRYDVVFLLADFCTHPLQDQTKEACKRAGVPFCLVRHGYGIAAFARAFEATGRRGLEALAQQRGEA